MENKVTQIKNTDGTFTYLVNGKLQIKNSKKDYNYFLSEVGVFSTSLNTMLNQEKYWVKNGNPKSMNLDKIKIVKIIKQK